jgi:hypothetical protein
MTTRKRGTWEPSGEEAAEPKVKVFIAFDSDEKLIGTTQELPISVARRKVSNGWARYADDKRSDKTDPSTVLKLSDGERMHGESGWGKGTPGSETKAAGKE